MFFFNFKKNYNNQYILYNYNLDQKCNLPILKKEYDKTILNYINYNNFNILIFKENISSLENINNILFINNSNNNININDNYNYNFYKDYDITKIFKYEFNENHDIFNIFNFKNFIYSKFNFIIQTHLENKDIYPLEENNFVLKNLLKKDTLNYKYLLLQDNHISSESYNDYLDLEKKKLNFYKNFYDILLLKNN
jgi:hypothetical protein